MHDVPEKDMGLQERSLREEAANCLDSTSGGGKKQGSEESTASCEVVS